MPLLAIGLMAAQADAADLMARATTRLSIARDAPVATGDDRYRIGTSPNVGPDRKRRALETTGGQCNVVGSVMCTRRPRTLLHAAIAP